MGSCSNKLFNRERTIHEILGSGIVADVMLWRKKDLSVGIVTVTIASWIVFESFAYTIFTLVSSVLLLLLSILFLWSKSASILNRPSPPLPKFQISEAMAEEVSELLLADFQTLCHTGVLVVMMVPAFYERYEDYMDGSIVFICNKAKELCLRFEIWAYPENKKLS